MTAFSNFLENKILLHVLANTSYTSPSTVYLGLHTADPTETGAVGELSGNGYARQSATFTEDTNGLVDNDAGHPARDEARARALACHGADFDGPA